MRWTSVGGGERGHQQQQHQDHRRLREKVSAGRRHRFFRLQTLLRRSASLHGFDVFNVFDEFTVFDVYDDADTFNDTDASTQIF